jgi:hypothetical protein
LGVVGSGQYWRLDAAAQVAMLLPAKFLNLAHGVALYN